MARASRRPTPHHPLYKHKAPKDFIEWAEGFNDLPQKSVRVYMPPKGHIWRANVKGSWHIHMPPHKRMCFNWCDYEWDSYDAMTAAVRMAWHQFLGDNSLTLEECPIANLFEAVA